MREIKVQVPRGAAKKVAELAESSQITHVTSHEIYVHSRGELKEEVKLKASTPQIKRFLAHLFRAPFFDRKNYSFSSHDVRALVSEASIASVTDPTCIPYSEIQQNFWQYSHITFSFVVRASVSAGLLGYAFLKDDLVLAIGAMIFTPFSPLILTVAFGCASGDWKLAKQGIKAFGVAFFLTLLSAGCVAQLHGGPILFNRFGSLSTNVLIAAVSGLMAALAEADDVGRHQLLGLAMAYPFVKFPTWLGLALAIGFPDSSTTAGRLAALVANALAMGVIAGVTFLAMGRRGERHDFPTS